ncbi:SDR family oxidoreductase [Geminocystis sp. GBBB08]|uniref:SDR family NAD(P)-dependent oxidoreductase n=1 Tax=Geminocystis sp. GBBB08 TaxID=2604140 RepID=UPI0027E29F83|nr:SDR family oxidoreductase [Geminocystis sp. GBBB08]MBL1211377.1 SDR family oxidoreductase [Geminocystis sp. GBBB08]
MKIKDRFRVAFNAFINPKKRVKQVIKLKEKEPSKVYDNQLLADKNILITGAGKNIGKSIAIEMGKQGGNIYFMDKDKERCQQLELELENYSVKYKGFVFDINNTQKIDSLISFFQENNINIDILVNNVGINNDKKGIKQIDLQDWEKIFNTNVFKPIYLTQKIVEMMINNQQGGAIIFITSIHQAVIFRKLIYSASKAALAMIIKELAMDLAPYNIRVNGIAPGWVVEDKEKNLYYHQYTHLHQSSINPCYIGRSAVYLASDYFSHFTTGAVITIDGGLSLYNYLVNPS